MKDWIKITYDLHSKGLIKDFCNKKDLALGLMEVKYWGSGMMNMTKARKKIFGEIMKEWIKVVYKLHSNGIIKEFCNDCGIYRWNSPITGNLYKDITNCYGTQEQIKKYLVKQ